MRPRGPAGLSPRLSTWSSSHTRGASRWVRAEDSGLGPTAVPIKAAITVDVRQTHAVHPCRPPDFDPPAGLPLARPWLPNCSSATRDEEHEPPVAPLVMDASLLQLKWLGSPDTATKPAVSASSAQLSQDPAVSGISHTESISGVAKSFLLCGGSPGYGHRVGSKQYPRSDLTVVGPIRHGSTRSSPSLHATETSEDTSRSGTMGG
jgi:hypothetical protein